MALCAECKSPAGFGMSVCPACAAKHQARAVVESLSPADRDALAVVGARREADAQLSRTVPLTTAQQLTGYRVLRTVDIITAECAFGMNLFRDFFTNLSDIFGGRSNTTQRGLRDARLTCLRELRAEARSVGGNAVIAVSLHYSEFSGQGKSMLFLVATGTAVVVEPE